MLMFSGFFCFLFVVSRFFCPQPGHKVVGFLDFFVFLFVFSRFFCFLFVVSRFFCFLFVVSRLFWWVAVGCGGGGGWWPSSRGCAVGDRSGFWVMGSIFRRGFEKKNPRRGLEPITQNPHLSPTPQLCGPPSRPTGL